MKKLLFLVLLSIAILPGCMSTREIETSSPRIFSSPESSDAAAAGMSLMAVELVTGETELPAEIQALRFRVDEVRVQNQDGEWLAFPSEMNSFEVVPGRRVNKTVLTTRVLPVAYDSLALKIRDVFVLFGENAGAPLTLPGDEAFGKAITLKTEIGKPSQVSIIFEPGASLARDPSCQWHFVPFWTVSVD